jgi:putative transposase
MTSAWWSWVGTLRRELCDRTLVWNRLHIECLLREYVEHYNTHRGSVNAHPDNAEVVAYRPGRPIRRHPTCGGLINQYRQAG